MSRLRAVTRRAKCMEQGEVHKGEVTMHLQDAIPGRGAETERKFTLEYWIDDGRYVGRLKEAPGVFSQGVDPQELEENIKDACRLIKRQRGI